MGSADERKRAAAQEAVEEVRPGMVLGLGTGSTVTHFLELLGERLRREEVGEVAGVATSVRTSSAARKLGIPLVPLDEETSVHLAVDGADEVDGNLNLVKGMGGALLREKMVAQAAERFVVVVDDRKLVSRLGSRSPLPVEVVPFGWASHLPTLRALGGAPTLRRDEGGDPYLTDNGNYVLHCRFEGGIEDPGELESALRGRAGIVETGLFLDLADEVKVGGGSGVRTLMPERGARP